MTSVRGKKAKQLSSQQVYDYRAQIEAIGKAQPVSSYDMRGIILDINENFEKLLGYSRAEVIGKHVSVFVDEQDRQTPQYQASLKALWERLNRGEVCEGEAKRCTKQGKEIWIRYSYNPVLDREGTPYKVINYFRDVTQQTLALADQAGQIAAISKALAVIEFHLDGTVITANDNFLKALGYTLDEIKGQHHSLFVDEAFRQSADYAEFWAKLRRGEYQAAEYKRIGKGGREVWIQASYNPILDLNGKPVKVVKYATDITDQKTAINAMMADAMMLSRAAVEGRLATRADLTKHHGDYRKVVEGINNTLDSVIGPINTAAEFVAKAAAGADLDEITAEYNGDFKVLKENLNILRRRLYGIIGEGQRLAQAGVNGELSTRADLSKYPGGWGTLIKGFNDTLDAVIGPLNVAADYVDKIGKGVIPCKITDPYNGDFNLIKNNLNACIDGLAGLQEGCAVAEKMAVNDFSRRVSSNYVGIFADLSRGVNMAQDRLVHVVSIVKNITVGNLADLDELKKIGRRSDQDELMPSFITMMENIRALISDARMLSEAAVQGKLATRADATRHQGDFRKVVEGVNSTLDAVIDPLNVAAKYVDDISHGLLEASDVLQAMAANDYTRRVARSTSRVKITDTYNGDFNTIKNNLNACVAALEEVGDATNKTADTLHASMKSIAQNSQALSSSSEQLAATSQQMSSNAEETSAQASTVATATQQVTTNLNSVATGAEEMTSTVQSISSNAGEAAKVAAEAVKTANGANATVAKLGESSAEIGQVIKVITSIAQQTNLLALNATIEAARAGEAGKGFAVVANEVKELAKQTAKATEDISQKITAIQDDTKRAVEAIGSITAIINQINDISGTIATAVEEQSATTNEMSRNVQEAAKGSGEISQNIQGVAAAAESTTRGAQDTLKAAQQLTEMATQLRRLVDQFKLTDTAEAVAPPAFKATAAHASA